jgi:mono/diheme cytochrome c family protein
VVRQLGAVATSVACLALAISTASSAEDELVARGEYLLRAGGCVSCHTDIKGGGRELAGGRALKTPFGTFFSPNITPDRQTGIGRWSKAQFKRALRFGLRPDRSHYFPAFPYTSYTRMSNADIRALRAYLFSRPPVRREDRPHELRFPFGWRFLLGPWKSLYFEPGAWAPDPDRSEQLNRGAYLVEALAHCGECHTPRNALGAIDREMWLAGTVDGPEGELAPNITPDVETGIGDWSAADLVHMLKTGFKPDYDDAQGAMAEAIDHGLKYLSDDDLEAIAAYMRALAPINNRVERLPQ